MGNVLKDFVNARTAGKALLVNKKVRIGIRIHITLTTQNALRAKRGNLGS